MYIGGLKIRYYAEQKLDPYWNEKDEYDQYKYMQHQIRAMAREILAYRELAPSDLQYEVTKELKKYSMRENP